jgi:hypothetical protein
LAGPVTTETAAQQPVDGGTGPANHERSLDTANGFKPVAIRVYVVVGHRSRNRSLLDNGIPLTPPADAVLVDAPTTFSHSTSSFGSIDQDEYYGLGQVSVNITPSWGISLPLRI